MALEADNNTGNRGTLEQPAVKLKEVKFESCIFVVQFIFLLKPNEQ